MLLEDQLAPNAGEAGRDQHIPSDGLPLCCFVPLAPRIDPVTRSNGHPTTGAARLQLLTPLCDVLMARKALGPTEAEEAKPVSEEPSFTDRAGAFLGTAAGKALKSAMQQAANQMGRQLVRGLLGSLLGGSKRK